MSRVTQKALVYLLILDNIAQHLGSMEVSDFELRNFPIADAGGGGGSAFRREACFRASTSFRRWDIGLKRGSGRPIAASGRIRL